MDYTTISNLNSKSRIIDLIKLDTVNCEFYPVKGDKLMSFVNLRFESNKWESRGYGCNIFPGIANQIETLIKNKNEIFQVAILYTANSDEIRRSFVSFYDGKDIMSIHSNGEKASLKADILELKSELERSKKTGEMR